MRGPARGFRWVGTDPVGAGSLKAADFAEAAILSVFKGFFAGFAVDVAAVMLALVVTGLVLPAQVPDYGYEGLLVVFDFAVLVLSPVIGLIGGLATAGLVRRGRGGILPVVAVWIGALACGVGLADLLLAVTQEDMTAVDAAWFAVPFLNSSLVHGTLIGLFCWRWLARRAPAELLGGPWDAGAGWRMMGIVAAGLLLTATATYSAVLLSGR